MLTIQGAGAEIDDVLAARKHFQRPRPKPMAVLAATKKKQEGLAAFLAARRAERSKLSKKMMEAQNKGLELLEESSDEEGEIGGPKVAKELYTVVGDWEELGLLGLA